MTPSYEHLFDVQWQLRRMKYLGGWDTEEQTRKHISDMLAYIGRAQDRYWKFVRVWRCMNVVKHALVSAEQHENATGLRLIKTFAKGLEIDFNRYKGAQVRLPFRKWNWGKVKADLIALYNDDRDKFNTLQEYCEHRLYAGRKQDPTDKASNPELQRFVRMMRDVVFDDS